MTKKMDNKLRSNLLPPKLGTPYLGISKHKSIVEMEISNKTPTFKLSYLSQADHPVPPSEQQKKLHQCP